MLALHFVFSVFFFFLMMMNKSYHVSCKFIIIQYLTQRETFNKRRPTLIRTERGAVIGKLNCRDDILLIELETTGGKKGKTEVGTMSQSDIEKLKECEKKKKNS